MTIEKILIVDDEMLIRNFLEETLKRKNFDVTTAQNVTAGFDCLKKDTFDLVITDMKMPDGTGLDILRRIKEIAPKTIVIIITAFGSIENAVEAMHLGAFNYLIKPFSPDTIEAIIEKAREHLSLIEENQYLRQESSERQCQNKIIYGSQVMKDIFNTVRRVAKSNANIFISGESGTGKEVISRAIHMNSLRANQPYIRVNCAAIPENLVESEFFGHEKGSFTGAYLKRTGRFELAHEGTLLLDEITEVPVGLQAKLLRAVQENEFERVGGSKVIKVDVRIVSTSNRDLKEAIRDKVFREDLYYRLNVVPIHLPPLRERTDDIIPLAEHFLSHLCTENHKKLKTLSKQAKNKLLEYHWPGNIRELSNVIERAIVMDYGSVIEAEHLYVDIKEEKKTSLPKGIPVGVTIQELEKLLILETLQQHNNNKTHSAETLGISIKTLRNKLKDYATN
jgi:two-component system, NtrC family, response regulator AtoC